MVSLRFLGISRKLHRRMRGHGSGLHQFRSGRSQTFAHSLFFLCFRNGANDPDMRWKRMVEYWPPFAVMFAAFALQPWLEGTRSAVTRLSNDMLDELQPFLDRPGKPQSTDAELHELWRTIGVSVAALVLAVAMFLNLRVTIHDIAPATLIRFTKRAQPG